MVGEPTLYLILSQSIMMPDMSAILQGCTITCLRGESLEFNSLSMADVKEVRVSFTTSVASLTETG